MRPNLFVNTPDILTEYLQFGGPAGVQDPRGARRDRSRRPGASTPGYELYEHVAAPGQRGEHRQREVPVQAARLGAAPSAAGRLARAVPRPGSTRSAREHPALASCATCTSTAATTTRPRATPSSSTATSPTAARDAVIVRRQRRPALGARDHGAPRHAASRASSLDERVRRSHDLLTGARVDVGRRTTTSGSTPFAEPVHILARRHGDAAMTTATGRTSADRRDDSIAARRRPAPRPALACSAPHPVDARRAVDRPRAAAAGAERDGRRRRRRPRVAAARTIARGLLARASLPGAGRRLPARGRYDGGRLDRATTRTASCRPSASSTCT